MDKRDILWIEGIEGSFCIFELKKRRDKRELLWIENIFYG